MDDAKKQRQDRLNILASGLPQGVKREELDQYAAFFAGMCGAKECSIERDLRDKVEAQKEQFPLVWEYIEAKVSAIRSATIEG